MLISCPSYVLYPEVMQQAERCISQFPGSALSYFALLDSSIQNESQETRMYYGMLLTKARDKMYIKHTSDSLMKEVESYGDVDKLMEACYYLGSVYWDMNDTPRAVTAFQQAAKIGKNSRRYDILERMNESLELEDLIEKITRTEAIGKINVSYNYQLMEEQNVKLVKDNKAKSRLLIVGTIFTTMIIYSYFRYAKKQKRIVREQETQIAQNKKNLLELILKESDIYQLFHQASYRHDITITVENWAELQEMIDKTYNGFTKRIYALYPKISEHELYICYMIKIHIPVKDIAKLLNRSTSAISNSRVRLYKKIYREEGKPKMLDKFIIDL
ncbi:MAG: hypothetical protein LBL58_02300 [Tannerellaceae bacterium]|jgi:hypothetical protein|nr:hypothetical protein [Tannerellaceae bacterium]